MLETWDILMHLLIKMATNEPTNFSYEACEHS